MSHVPFFFPGSHSNIVGLPLKATAQLLAEAGITPARPSTIPLE